MDSLQGEEKKASALYEKLQSSVKLTSQPVVVENCTMYPYQLEGLNWLISLNTHNLNGILGDEMGLGKTLQSLSVLGYLREVKKQQGPFLIIAPLSTIGNWCNEITKFLPSMSVERYIGTKEEREDKRAEIVKFIMQQPKEQRKQPKLPFNILVTTYQLVIKDILFIKKFAWNYLIVDEAHHLKNCESILYQTLSNDCVFERKLLLTGTPLQNSLKELWSLLHFIEPKTFNDMQLFEGWFSSVDWKKASKNISNSNVTKVAHQKRLEQLHTLMRPYFLRRLKDDVNLSIPNKREVVLYAGLTEMQKKYYTWVLTKNVTELRKGGSNKTNLMNLVMHLRKCCNHPYLFDGAEPTFDGEFVLGDHLVENSSKMMILDSLLPKLQKEGHKILIYSQMTRMLDILQDYMTLRKFPYERLDGSCRSEERYLAIKNFNEKKETFAFLLSTRAGGVGLNLVSANFVLFFDSDWNPQMDKQAEARAHRIGQKKNVTVIRLVSRHTVEELILQRAKSKLHISNAVIEEGAFDQKDEDKSNEEPSKESIFSVIKYSIRDVCGDDNYSVPPITDHDIDLILNPPEIEVKSDSPSIASFGGTLEILNDDEDDEDDVVVYGSSNLPSKSSSKNADEFLDKFIKENTNEEDKVTTSVGRKRTRSPVKRDSPPSPKKQRTPKRKKTTSSYISASIALEEEEDTFGSLTNSISDDSEDLLQFVVGDVTCPQTTGNTIIASCMDDSGRWSKGGMFRALDKLSPEIQNLYLKAKKNRDLKLGDVHVIPITESVYIALLIAQKYTKRNPISPINLKDLAICLRKLAQFANTINASAHLPRLGATTPSFNWYNTERYIRKELCGKHIPTYIYYFKRGVTPKTPILVTKKKSISPTSRNSIISPSSSPIPIIEIPTELKTDTVDENDKKFISKYKVTNPLPNFLIGLRVSINISDLKTQELISRHIIAYGGTICTGNEKPQCCIGKSSTIKVPSISSSYIIDCVKKKEKLDWKDYLDE